MTSVALGQVPLPVLLPQGLCSGYSVHRELPRAVIRAQAVPSASLSAPVTLCGEGAFLTPGGESFVLCHPAPGQLSPWCVAPLGVRPHPVDGQPCPREWQLQGAGKRPFGVLLQEERGTGPSSRTLPGRLRLAAASAHVGDK